MAKVKIPKRVAGVKVPKKVRKQARRALKLAAAPAVRDLALTGLTLAAERVLEEAKRGGGERTASDSGARVEQLDLGAVIHAAVAEGARRFLQGFEEGAAAAAPPAPKPKARRKPAPATKSAKPVKKRASPKPGGSTRRRPG